MSTKTDLYVGRGHDAEWIGSLQWDCTPENLLRVPPGRLALTATDEATYRAAVADLFIVWETEDLGRVYPSVHGWPWLWHTSHRNSWIITYDPNPGVVFVTVGGGVRWLCFDPLAPNAARDNNDALEPPDFAAWLREPVAPPSVPLPLMRDPATGLPTPAGGS
jgi:hypothetical protein